MKSNGVEDKHACLHKQTREKHAPEREFLGLSSLQAFELETKTLKGLTTRACKCLPSDIFSPGFVSISYQQFLF